MITLPEEIKNKAWLILRIGRPVRVRYREGLTHWEILDSITISKSGILYKFRSGARVSDENCEILKGTEDH